YRRWQLALVVAGLQLVLLPLQRAVHPQGNSLASYYLVSTLCVAAIVVWGMFLRGRRQTQRERARRCRGRRAAARRTNPSRRAHAHRARDARRPRPPDLAAGTCAR